MAKMENDEMKNGKLIPRLRFPGFEGEWEEKKLGEVATFKRGMTITAKDTKNGDVPVIAGGQTPSYYHNVSNREGETIAISGSGAYAGFVSFWNTPVFLSDSFSVETEIDINKKYAFYYLKHKQQDLFFMQKGAGVPHVHGTDVGNLIIPLPSLPEQQKIASCLSELDNLIAAQGQKVDALKEKKKGLMQQLFPQPGETTPRLRFPGFEGEWVEKKIGEFGQIITGSTPSRQNMAFWNGDFCWVSAQDMKGKYIYETKEKVTEEGKKQCRLLPKNTVLVTCIASIGLNSITKVECATNQQINAIVAKDELEAEFIYQSMERYTSLLKALAGQTAVPIVNKQQFYNFTIFVPPIPEEQQKIASCLSSLDDLIAAESAKVEALKDHKKGLMQQLFPQPTK